MKKLILMGVLATVLIFSGCEGRDESDYAKRTESVQQSTEVEEGEHSTDSQTNGDGLGDENFPNVADDDYTKRY